MKYMLVFDNEHTCDGYELPWAETEEAAKEELKDTYIEWEMEEMWHWNFTENGIPIPTEDQIESWDCMYWNCSCWLVPFNEETGKYSEDEDDEIYLTNEELEEIGWMEWEKYVEKWGLKTT